MLRAAIHSIKKRFVKYILSSLFPANYEFEISEKKNRPNQNPRIEIGLLVYRGAFVGIKCTSSPQAGQKSYLRFVQVPVPVPVRCFKLRFPNVEEEEKKNMKKSKPNTMFRHVSQFFFFFFFFYRSKWSANRWFSVTHRDNEFRNVIKLTYSAPVKAFTQKKNHLHWELQVVSYFTEKGKKKPLENSTIQNTHTNLTWLHVCTQYTTHTHARAIFFLFSHFRRFFLHFFSFISIIKYQ